MHKYIWTALTALATWASLVWLLGHTLTLIFVVGIFVHEFGHAIVGHWVGLRKINIEFAPFLGGRTYYANNFSSQRDLVLMVMAGPVSGLLFAWIAYALFVVTGWEPLRVFAAVNILLSLLNLFPISPLDGGHVFASLLFPCRATTTMWLELILILAIVPLAYAVGVPIFVTAPIAIVGALTVIWFMRRVIDVERVKDAAADYFGLKRSDSEAVIGYIKVAADEELLQVASRARKKYRRFFLGRRRFITDDYWLGDGRYLAYFLQQHYRPPMGYGWKTLTVLLLALTVGLCILLGWLLVGAEDVVIRFLQIVVNL